jgi:transposase-like protein
VAIEMLQPKGFGRVRLQRVPSATQKHVLPFACNAIESGSVMLTDGSPIYKPLLEHGFTQHKIVHLGSADPAHAAMPGVHRVASLLKRWLLGTHQGSVHSQQLDYYLDEYTFRFNRRPAKSRGLFSTVCLSKR